MLGGLDVSNCLYWNTMERQVRVRQETARSMHTHDILANINLDSAKSRRQTSTGMTTHVASTKLSEDEDKRWAFRVTPWSSRWKMLDVAEPDDVSHD